MQVYQHEGVTEPAAPAQRAGFCAEWSTGAGKDSGGSGSLGKETMTGPTGDGAETGQAGRAPRRAGSGSLGTVAVGLLAVIAVILGAAALKASAAVTMPLAFAFFVTALVHPIQTRLSERLPDRLHWLGLVAAMLVFVGVGAFAGALIWLSVQPVMTRAPQYLDQLQQQWHVLGDWAGAHGLPVPQRFVLNSGWVLEPVAAQILLLWSVPALLVLVFFFTLMMLIEASAWRRKTEAALRHRHTMMVLDTVSTISDKLRRYVLIRTAVSMVNGVAAGLWLWFMDVDFALFWGVMVFLFNYIPTIGSIVAATPPVLLAFVQFGFGWSLLVALGLLAIDQVLGNYFDPRFLGKALNVSSLVALLSVIFWGWVWGVAGALLAVPLTITIILFCAQVPALQPIAILLGGDVDGEA
jgi:predicted PurR-regulated permease PerM